MNNNTNKTDINNDVNMNNTMNKTDMDNKDKGFKSSYSKGQRILALLGLILIAVLLVALLWNSLTGGDPRVSIALLFCLIVVPCVLYGFRLYVDYTVRKHSDKSDK